jgi:hypothetical protein
MQTTLDIEKSLKALDRRVKLNISINELRILVGCLRAIEYQMMADDEPYLDPEGLALKARLSSLYEKMLRDG